MVKVQGAYDATAMAGISRRRHSPISMFLYMKQIHSFNKKSFAYSNYNARLRMVFATIALTGLILEQILVVDRHGSTDE